MWVFQHGNYALVIEKDFVNKEEKEELIENICQQLQKTFIFCSRCGKYLISESESFSPNVFVDNLRAKHMFVDHKSKVCCTPGGDFLCLKCGGKSDED